MLLKRRNNPRISRNAHLPVAYLSNNTNFTSIPFTVPLWSASQRCWKWKPDDLILFGVNFEKKKHCYLQDCIKNMSACQVCKIVVFNNKLGLSIISGKTFTHTISSCKVRQSIMSIIMPSIYLKLYL